MDANALRALISSRKPHHTLPRPFYNDPAIFDADLRHIHHREWLFVGHDCELAKPGDFITWKVGDAEAIVVRGKDGAIRAFHNTCRHRGSRICTAAKGSATNLVCPYHQWTYGFDGKLIYARDMGAEFDPTRWALKPVHCESVCGWIFICFAASAPDFAPFREMVAGHMAPYGLTETKIAHQTSTVEKGNWKLVWENNRECYHCSGSHPGLTRTFPEDPKAVGLGDASVVADFHARCEAAGLPSVYRAAPDLQYRVMRAPLLGKSESYTMTGKMAVAAKPILRQTPPEPVGSVLLYHYPICWNHLLRDHALSFRVTPIAPQLTEVTTRWLVRKDAVEGVDYDLKTLTEIWDATNDEDRRLVEQNQLGVNQPAYEPGPYAPTHELGVDQFVDWYCATLWRNLEGDAALMAAE